MTLFCGGLRLNNNVSDSAGDVS